MSLIDFKSAKHELRMAWKRYQIRKRKIPTGLGDSGWLLNGLIRSMKPEVCVEIGSAQGWSTCLIALALEQNLKGTLYAVDPHIVNEWSHELPSRTLSDLRDNLSAIGLNHRVKIIPKTTAGANSDLPESIDFAFIDGDHSYEGVKKDWKIIQPKLSSWAVVVFHDTMWEINRQTPEYKALINQNMGVPRFLDELRQQGYPLVTINSDWGISLLQSCKGSKKLRIA